MRKNEPTAGDRVAVVPFYDQNGQLKTGIAFNGAGECAVWNVDSLAFTDTTNDPVEIGATGQYSIQLTQAETNHSTILVVRLRKAGYEDQYLQIPVTTYDLDDISARLDTIDATLATIAGYIDTEVAAIKAKTDNLPAAPAATGDIPSAATIAAAVFAFTTETGVNFVQLCRALFALAAGAELDDSAPDTDDPIVLKSADGTKNRMSAVWVNGVKTVTKDFG